MNTANGVIRVTECIEMQLLELGGARTLTFHVMDDSPNLLSTSKLCLEDGYTFWWDPKTDERAHLISPEGKHIALYNSGGTPNLRTRERIVNKINEFEAYAVMDAKPQTDSTTSSTSPVGSMRLLCGNDLSGDYFFLEIFFGSGR